MSNLSVKFCTGDLCKFEDVPVVPRTGDVVQLASGLTFLVQIVFIHKNGVSVRGAIDLFEPMSRELLGKILEKQFGWDKNESILEKFNGLQIKQKPDLTLVIEDIDEKLKEKEGL